MKKWLRKIRDWFYWNDKIIITIAVIVTVVLLVTALVVALVIGIDASNDMSEETAWLINPTNPASPMNLLP